MSFPRRVLAGLLLVASLAILVIFPGYAQRPSPATIEETVGTAVVSFSADRTVVYAGGDCITLSWQAEGIREIWLMENPVTGMGDAEWCVPLAATVGQPTLRVRFADDDEWHNYSLDIGVLQPIYLYTVVPALLLAAWLLQLQLRLPTAFRTWLIRREAWRYPLLEPFLEDDVFNLNVIYIFIAINLLVLSNTVRQSSRVAYDEQGHRYYVNTLVTGHLPTIEDSGEFFSPPLPYVVPALGTHLGQALGCPSDDEACTRGLEKIGQLQNVLVSLGITFFILKLCHLLQPGQGQFKTATLLLVGILPVYYKTLSFLRGEPFVVLFTLILIYHLTTILKNQHATRFQLLLFGVFAGLLMLSRQWGALVLVAIVLWLGMLVVIWNSRRRLLIGIATSLVIVGAVVGGWFYLSLQLRFGSFLSFNRDAVEYDESGEFPLTLFGEASQAALFTAPLEDAFSREAIPRFYAEIWGDYSGYFVFIGSTPTQPVELLRYMGLINAIALLPTALLLIGTLSIGFRDLYRLFGSKAIEHRTAVNALLFLTCVISVIGYSWFVSRFTLEFNAGDTVKATYLLHIFALMAVLTATFLMLVRRRHQLAYSFIIGMLPVIWLVNLPAMITRNTLP